MTTSTTNLTIGICTKSIYNTTIILQNRKKPVIKTDGWRLKNYIY